PRRRGVVVADARQGPWRRAGPHAAAPAAPGPARDGGRAVTTHDESEPERLRRVTREAAKDLRRALGGGAGPAAVRRLRHKLNLLRARSERASGEAFAYEADQWAPGWARTEM